ncbi:MAG: MBL fold metallo-hydrolase [Alphaproteobacteria bacterium]
MAAGGLRVRFWGVRGSVACSGKDTIRYGGNTSCVEVRCGPHLLIFDAGTGLRPLGRALDSGGAVEGDLFFSHTHHDHIAGIPFFRPLYDKANRFQFWAGHLLPERTLHEVLCMMMQDPLFPVPFEVFKAEIAFKDFRCGEELRPRPDVVLRTTLLNHPNRAVGYRVDYRGKSVCYVTDNEHKPGERDRNVLELADGADVLIYDSMYTDEEYPRYAGWGHSTWQEGVRVAEAAKVKTLVLFHHDPDHDDSFLDRVQRAAKRAWPGARVAREGMVIAP